MSKYILVTGANSGLGLGICTRLIDDYLRLRQQQQHGEEQAEQHGEEKEQHGEEAEQHGEEEGQHGEEEGQNDESASLTIIFTTRSQRKGQETQARLLAHLRRAHPPHTHRHIRLRAENVELTNLLSVRALAQKLVSSSTTDLPHLDAVVCNAGIGGWTGLNWPLAVWSILLDIRRATTWPEYKLGAVGLVARPQPLSPAGGGGGGGGGGRAQPPLGEVFCANVFGHYMLAHWLMPLLWAARPPTPGRLIWVSSVEAAAHHYRADDHQALRTDAAYEHTKRLTDLLALTAHGQPATARPVDEFLEPAATRRPRWQRPRILLTHPGVATTSIVSLPWLLAQGYVLGIYLARWAGGVWSNVSPYTGAAAVTWAALASADELRAKEAEAGGAGEGKWGTAIDRAGTTAVRRTEADGWGIDGSGRPYSDTWWGGVAWLGGGYVGRRRGAVDAGPEDVENFVVAGAEAWRQMEELRLEWEARLEGSE